MELQLTPDERQLLLELLRDSMRELSREIAHTDDHNYKLMLKQKLSLTEALVDRLAVAKAA